MPRQIVTEKQRANLRPPRKLTTEEARKLGRKGGIKSAKVRKEKILLSQMYADILADQSGIKGGRGIKAVIAEILNETDMKSNSSRVSLIKELREGTEGSKIKTESTITVNTEDEATKTILAQYGINPPTV